ncbi:hypothetical protein [Flavobacterium sp. SM2513]|uniref:hypothetical protein n=1 Tax=Flavobacterium sp. SM2513 TaxID=3424766 RepID=UPI003D7FCAE6
MKKFITKIIVYTAIILIIANGIAWLSLYFLGQSQLYKPQFVKNGVKEKHFDYVVLGSSTGLTTLDTKQIDSTINTTGLNISMDDTALNTHYLMLQYFYAQNKTTDYLVLAVTPWDLANKEPVLSDNDYRFFSEQYTDVVHAYYQSIPYKGFPVLKYSAYVPILGVSYYNTELFYPSLLTIVQPKKRNRFDDRGNYSYPSTGVPKETAPNVVTAVIKNPYFEKIEALCKEKGIQLIVYQSPLYKTKVDLSGQKFVINHSDFLKDKSLFYDNLHVNKEGRTSCSANFALKFQSIKEKP